jgi:hypothetical protein
MMLAIGLLAAASTLTFADRTEVRARDTSGSLAGTDQSADLESDPELRLRVRGNHDDDELQLYYTPRLILSHFAYSLCGPSTEATQCGPLPNVGGSYASAPTPEILNGGGVSFKHQHGRTAVALIEQATHGTVDAASLLNEPLWTGAEAPPPIFPIAKYPALQLELVTSYGGVSLYEQLTPRLDLQASVSVGVYGGPDNASRATFPLTESPGVQLKLEGSVTRLDDLAISAGADYTAVTTYTGVVPGYAPGPGAPFDVAPASPQYSVRGYGEARARHRWSRLATTEIAGGGVAAFQQQQPLTTSPAVTSATTPYPMAEIVTTVGASAAPQPAAHAELVAIARVQPWIDIFDGTLVERAEGVVGAIGALGLDTYRAEIVGHYVVPTDSSPGRYRLLYGELDYARQVDPAFSVDFGARAGAEAEGEVYACSGSTEAACAQAPRGPTAAGGTIYEGELFIGFSWKPLPVKL